MSFSSFPYIVSHRTLLYFRVRVPQRLQACLGRQEYRRSLGTAYLHQAKPVAIALAARMMDVFRLADAYLTATAKGQVMPDPTTPESILTNERIRAIADRLLKDILDETYRTRFRDVPKVLDTFAWAEMRGILAGEAIERWHENDLDAYKANVDAELEAEGINDIPRNSIPYLKLCRAVAAIDYAVNLAASRPSFDGTLDKAAQESYESHVGIPKLPHPSQTVAPTQGATPVGGNLYGTLNPVYGTSHGTSYGTFPPTPCGTTVSGHTPVGPALPSLSEAVATYLRMNERKWSPSTRQDKQRMVEQFKGICIEFHGGDFPIGQLGWEMVQHYSDTFPKLPTGASAEVRNGKTYRELAAMEDGKTVTPTTVENNFTAVRAFLNWAGELYQVRGKFLAKRLDAPEVVDRAQSLVTLPGQRRPYTRDELAAVFAPEPYLAATKKHPARFWLPLIALFTGARVEEIAQLHREDIRQEKEVWIFDINDAGDKRLKTKASRRHVPVHPLLIELGFLEFVSSTPKREKRVFYALTPDSRMKYGHSVTKWYTRYRREQGIGGNTGEKSELDLHAFRHLFISRSVAHDVSRLKLKAVVGHEKDLPESDTTDIYTTYDPQDLLDTVVGIHNWQDELPLRELAASPHAKGQRKFTVKP